MLTENRFHSYYYDRYRRLRDDSDSFVNKYLAKSRQASVDPSENRSPAANSYAANPVSSQGKWNFLHDFNSSFQPKILYSISSTSCTIIYFKLALSSSCKTLKPMIHLIFLFFTLSLLMYAKDMEKCYKVLKEPSIKHISTF